jgi:hypothetical protein
MRRLTDSEILGVYAPRGLSRPIAEGQEIACVRLHCARTRHAAGARAHRWAPRQSGGPAIELCPRCHLELATILSGG